MRGLFSCFFNEPATTEIYTYVHTLSLHDALPISAIVPSLWVQTGIAACAFSCAFRPEDLSKAVAGAAARTAAATNAAMGMEMDWRTVSLPGESSRSEEHTSELQSLMRISYAVFCLKKKKQTNQNKTHIMTRKTLTQA